MCHPHFHATPCPTEPPQTSQTGPSPPLAALSRPALRALHTLPWAFALVQHKPRLSPSWVPSLPLALGPACRNPSHPNPGQTTRPSCPSGLAPNLTIGLGPVLSLQGLCKAPGSPKAGGTAVTLRVLCHAKWDWPDRGILKGFLEEEVQGPCLPVLTPTTWPATPTPLGLTLRVWY